jgi:hypothetical protein
VEGWTVKPRPVVENWVDFRAAAAEHFDLVLGNLKHAQGKPS